MPYIITNGSNYIKTTSSGKVAAVADAHQARVFQSETRAEGFCSCLPNAYRKLNYYVVPFEGTIAAERQTSAEDGETKYIPLIPPAEGLDEKAIDFEYILESVRRFEDMMILLRSQQKLIEQERNHTDAQIFDIEHIAEFSVLSAPKAYKVYKKLHDARVRRRKCKNSLDALQYISEVISPDIYSRKMSKSLEGLMNRTFTPRALPEFYHEICDITKEME